MAENDDFPEAFGENKVIEWVEEQIPDRKNPGKTKVSTFAVVGKVDPKLIDGYMTHVKNDGRVCIIPRKQRLSPEEIQRREQEKQKKRDEWSKKGEQYGLPKLGDSEKIRDYMKKIAAEKKKAKLQEKIKKEEERLQKLKSQL